MTEFVDSTYWMQAKNPPMMHILLQWQVKLLQAVTTNYDKMTQDSKMQWINSVDSVGHNAKFHEKWLVSVAYENC